jgi:hypothetical protein
MKFCKKAKTFCFCIIFDKMLSSACVGTPRVGLAQCLLTDGVAIPDVNKILHHTGGRPDGPK